MSLDGATVEVIRSYLLSAAEEMRRTLIRTAFNPVIYEVLDFGISIHDIDLELIADAPGLAFFLGANDYAIPKGVAHVGMETMLPGDIFVMNYPYWNSAHAPDMTLFAPVFAPGADRPFAFTCIRAHWLDIGAKDPGYVLDSTDMHQEGLIFPGTRIYRDGEPVKDVIDIIRFNSRMPGPVLADLEAQVAATRTGVTRLNAILEKFGREAFDEAIARIKAHSEVLVRKAMADLPHGTWEASDFIDDDGVSDDPVPIHVRVTIDDEGMTCDFSESSAAVRGPINIPIGLTETICKFVLKSLTTPEQRNNAGSFRALKVIAPEGNLFHAVYPSATFTQWSANAALELVYKALSQGMPERIAACSGGDTLGFMMIGTSRTTGQMYAISNNEPVGWGASIAHDGINATNHISGNLVRSTPIEVMEMKTGMMMESYEILPDSAGAGRTRGGAGIERKIRFVEDGEFLCITKRSKEKPWALLGGGQPEANAMIVGVGTRDEKKVGTYRTGVRIGDRMTSRAAGGAGFGDPLERAPAAVLEDVLDGYLTLDAARQLYKVAIERGAVDEAATAVLRAAA
jgi:N-methylhydantoinase B